MFHIIRDNKLKERDRREYMAGIQKGLQIGRALGHAEESQSGCIIPGYDTVKEAERILKENGNAKRD